MNVRLIHNFCMVVLLVIISSCIREDLSGCPPSAYAVRVSVKDKNYSNVDNFSQLVRMPESSPFSSFEGTIYYILTDPSTGKTIRESSITPLSGGEQTYSITFGDVPDGEYRLTVWGNVTSDYPIGVLHRDSKEYVDVYVGSATLKFGPNYQPVEIPLERTKGLLLLVCYNFPSAVTSIEQSVNHIYPSVDANLNYMGDTNVLKRVPFQTFITTALSPTSSGTSKVKLRFFADNLDAANPFFELPEMDLAVRRNEVSAISVDYKAADGVWEVQAFIQGEWVTLNRLTIE